MVCNFYLHLIYIEYLIFENFDAELILNFENQNLCNIRIEPKLSEYLQKKT